MKNYDHGDSGFMTFKLDMSKTYDWVEWSFLENLMRKMGFKERWIGLIMVCVKPISYSILINDKPKELITPTRGIRQGDPLSHFLFLLGIESLHGLINNAKSRGDIKGFSLCKRGPTLTHMLFADDNLLFCRATSEECAKVLNILEAYEQASGQKVNKNKTAIFFSKSTSETTKQAIQATMGHQKITQYEYLGLPSLIGRGKKESFSYIKEKVWWKL